MSDLLGIADEVDELHLDDTLPPYTATVRPCQAPGCTQEIPVGSHPARKYCDTHYVGSSKKKSPKKKGDAPPVNISFKASSVAGKTAAVARQAKVASGATSVAQMLAAAFAMAGDAECAAAFAQGAEQWGASMAELSKYQPWIASIFAPTGDLTGQASAWIGVLIATAGIAVPVLAHHNMIRPDIAEKFGVVMVLATEKATTVMPDGIPDDPAAAAA